MRKYTVMLNDCLVRFREYEKHLFSFLFWELSCQSFKTNQMKNKYKKTVQIHNSTYICFFKFFKVFWQERQTFLLFLMMRFNKYTYYDIIANVVYWYIGILFWYLLSLVLIAILVLKNISISSLSSSFPVTAIELWTLVTSWISHPFFQIVVFCMVLGLKLNYWNEL